MLYSSRFLQMNTFFNQNGGFKRRSYLLHSVHQLLEFKSRQCSSVLNVTWHKRRRTAGDSIPWHCRSSSSSFHGSFSRNKNHPWRKAQSYAVGIEGRSNSSAEVGGCTGGASWRPMWAPAPLPPKKFMRLWFILLVRLLQATHVFEFIHGSCRTIQRGPRAIMSIAFLAFCIVWLCLLDNASRRSLFIVFASCCYLTGCGARCALLPGHMKKSIGLLRSYS